MDWRSSPKCTELMPLMGDFSNSLSALWLLSIYPPLTRTRAARPLAANTTEKLWAPGSLRIGHDRRYGAHSMRATFLTTALGNRASLEDVQSAAGHADPSTTKLYD
jgi:integrase